MAAPSDDIELADLIERFELKPATAALLAENGFESIQSVALIDDGTIADLAINKGQSLLLRAMVAAAKNITQDQSAANSVENPGQVNLDHLLASLQSAAPPVNAPQLAGTSVHPNPLHKPVDITQLVSLHPSSGGEAELSVVDGRLCVGSKRTPRDKLSLAQYMEGALKAYSTLQARGAGENYLSYLTRVAQLAQVFQWQSVLLFDREFRRLQAESNLPWDTECSYLMTLLLRPLPSPSSTTANSKYDRRPRKDPASGKEVCIRFNKGTCTSTACRFAHMCMICLGPHQELNHPKNGVSRYTDPKNGASS